MKSKLKHAVKTSSGVVQKGSKAPYPTNFSNNRSQLYMSSADENHIPNSTDKAHPKPTGFASQKIKPKVPVLNLQKTKELAIPPKEMPEDLLKHPQSSRIGLGRKLVSDNKSVANASSIFSQRMTPRTATAAGTAASTAAGPLTSKRKLEKLCPKLLPPTHDSDINDFSKCEDEKEEEANEVEGVNHHGKSGGSAKCIV